MRQELVMPQLGLTMTEGALVEWMLVPGDAFKAGAPVFTVETDKVTNEIVAEDDGVLLDILVPVGQTVPVGTPLAYVEYLSTGRGGTPGEPPGSAVAPQAPSETTSPAPSGTSPAVPADPQRVLATPYARRLAVEAGLGLDAVVGSGPGGRIKAADVRASRTGPAAGSRPPGAGSSIEAVPVAAEAGSISRPTPTQVTIARRMVQSKQEIPHFYLASEAEVSRLLALRQELSTRPGYPKLTLTHMLVAAIGRALHQLPELNRVWTDEGILSLASTDVGVAVNTSRGLWVPVVPDVASQPLDAVARASQDLIDKARRGELQLGQMRGGAVTLSNAGMFNVSWMTPIINPDQAMILGVGSVRELFRPDPKGNPSLRRELGLVLAADHRILDGVSGLRMLNAVVALLEDPARLLV